MKVVLAEKPSVARDIARYLRATAREDGYLEGNGYQVTWAFGHLVSLAEPAHYDAAFKKWSLDPLPIVPEPFQLALTGNKDARKQFNIIKRLLCAASEIIAATDAGREGELIFRYILQMTGCSKTPVRRLWLSSLTHDAISSAFASLRPLSDYDNLFAAARCRAEADWIVGINATRYFTLKYPMKDTLWSVGRVQTPLLAMIVARDDAIRDFNPKSFWELHTTYRKTLFRFTGPRFTAKKDAQEKLHLVLGHHLVIHKVDTTTERANPPKLFDLTELQREMNRLHNLSASDTLSAAQSLYEKKLITYPRTDSRYLTKDIEATIPGILRALSSLRPTEIAKLDLAKLSFSKRITDDKKVADHHAIIPTGTIPDQLTEIDQSLFDAISTRLIAAFYPPCSSQVTTVDATANQVPFRAKGVRVTNPGWKELYAAPNAKADPDTQSLPQFKPQEKGPHKPTLNEGKTTPPKHFTEDTLLGQMETAGKLVDDEELAEAMKERGLGTPATRSSMIEILLQRNYVKRSRSRLTATEAGRCLVALIEDQKLKSPELTGDMEVALKQIEHGTSDPDSFMQSVAAYAQEIIEKNNAASKNISELAQAFALPATAPDPAKPALGNCPECDAPVLEQPKSYSCSRWRDGCKFTIWKKIAGKRISTSMAKALLSEGQTRVLKGFKSKAGNPFSARLKLEGLDVKFDFPVRE